MHYFFPANNKLNSKFNIIIQVCIHRIRRVQIGEGSSGCAQFLQQIHCFAVATPVRKLHHQEHRLGQHMGCDGWAPDTAIPRHEMGKGLCDLFTFPFLCDRDKNVQSKLKKLSAWCFYSVNKYSKLSRLVLTNLQALGFIASLLTEWDLHTDCCIIILYSAPQLIPNNLAHQTQNMIQHL
jgi:hypothetical protein